jgi:hypothetical protein
VFAHCPYQCAFTATPNSDTLEQQPPYILFSLYCKLQAHCTFTQPHRETETCHHYTAQSILFLIQHTQYAKMLPNDPRHLLPVNSMLFRDQPAPRPLATDYNPTLANLHEAQDTTVTALPQPRVAAQPSSDGDTQSPRPTFCSSLLAAIKKMWPFRKIEKEMVIGEPTDFRHLETGGPRPLMGSRGEVEDDWEDLE